MMTLDRVAIRDFTAQDADEVSALIRATLLTSNAGDYAREELEAIADWYCAAGLVSRLPYAHRLVAAPAEGPHAGRIIGTAARRENQVEAVFVAPDWQGAGVGAALMGLLEQGARTLAMRALWLESSLTAVGFYERLGYESAGGVRDAGEGLVQPMRKRL